MKILEGEIIKNGEEREVSQIGVTNWSSHPRLF